MIQDNDTERYGRGRLRFTGAGTDCPTVDEIHAFTCGLWSNGLTRNLTTVLNGANSPRAAEPRDAELAHRRVNTVERFGH
jgi:hypothetical protein